MDNIQKRFIATYSNKYSYIKTLYVRFDQQFGDFQQEYYLNNINTQSAITCAKLTIETLKQGVKYVQN